MWWNPLKNPWAALAGVFVLATIVVTIQNPPRKSDQDGSSSRPEGTITRADLGEAWPFTVDEGQLRCQVITRPGVDRTLPAVTFIAEGRTYAINGWALTYRLGEDIRSSGIWRDDPSIGAKRSIGPIIDRGLALCR